MVLYLIILGGFGVLLVASIGTLREAVRQRARPRGFLVAIGAALLALVGIWAVLI